MPASPLTDLASASDARSVEAAKRLLADAEKELGDVEDDVEGARELFEETLERCAELEREGEVLAMELHDGWVHRAVLAKEQPADYAARMAAAPAVDPAAAAVSAASRPALAPSPLWDGSTCPAAMASAYSLIRDNRRYLASEFQTSVLGKLRRDRDAMEERVFRLRMKLVHTHELHERARQVVAAAQEQVSAAAAGFAVGTVGIDVPPAPVENGAADADTAQPRNEH